MGYVYALGAALLFGANGSVTRVIVEAGISPAQLTFLRVASTAALAAIWLLVVDRRAFRITPRQLLVMAVLGVVGVALLQWTYAVAISLLPVGITLLLQYLAVLAVALIAKFVFRERVRSRIWLAIALVLGGLVLVASDGADRLDLLGVLFALAAATALTTYFLVGERLLDAVSPMAVAFWSMLFATVFWGALSGWWEIEPAALAAWQGLGGALDGVVVPLWVLLAANALLGSFAPFVLSLLALRRLRATSAGIAASAEVVFAFVIAWLWLGEVLAPLQLAGAGLVVVAIALAQTARSGAVNDADLATSALMRESGVDGSRPPRRADVGGPP